MRRLTLAIATGLLLAGPAQGRESGSLDARVLGLVDHLLEGNSVGCGRAFEPLFDTTGEPGFDQLPVATRRKVLTATVACSRRKATSRAVAVVRRLEPLADSSLAIADANQVLLEAAARADEFPEAARRLIRVIDADPARVAKWRPRFIGAVAYGKGVSDDTTLSLALFKRLTSMAWVKPDARASSAPRKR